MPVALVTGSSQGIGSAIALALAEDGFDIALNDLGDFAEKASVQELMKQIGAKGRKICVVPANVADEQEVERMVEETVEKLGGLDVMVANAGIAILSDILDMPIEAFDRVVAVNMRGMYLCYQHAARQMVKQGRGGRIIGASSTAGVSALSGGSAYGATKAGIRGLTQAAAKDLGKYSITVNCYAPGYIKTPMFLKVAADSGLGDENLTSYKSESPLGLVGEPEDIAGMVVYLASAKAKYITGQTFMLNGGMLCL